MAKSSRREIGKKQLLSSQNLDKSRREIANKKIIDIEEEIKKLKNEDPQSNINQIKELEENLKALREIRDGRD